MTTTQHHHHDHNHDHDHDHDHDARPEEPRLPPSTEGSAVMEVGGNVGALVVYVPSELAGREIEIARPGEPRPFVHTEVRERQLPDGAIYAGVFPGVPAGDYTLLAFDALPAVEVHIEGGRVAEVSWV